MASLDTYLIHLPKPGVSIWQRKPRSERNPCQYSFYERSFCGERAFEIPQRHILFNMNELKRAAAKAVVFESYAKVEKDLEAVFNKTFLSIMQRWEWTPDREEDSTQIFDFQLLAWWIEVLTNRFSGEKNNHNNHKKVVAQGRRCTFPLPPLQHFVVARASQPRGLDSLPRALRGRFPSE